MMGGEKSQPLEIPMVKQENGTMDQGSAHRNKLFGREFYRSIGSPEYIVAPMVDRSEFVSI
jgi:tRNA-dihydrouridine synthase 1